MMPLLPPQARAAALRDAAQANAPSSPDNLGVPKSAWVKSKESSDASDRQYSAGEGATFFIDGARWLPDNVTACNAQLALVDSQVVVVDVVVVEVVVVEGVVVV